MNKVTLRCPNCGKVLAFLTFDTEGFDLTLPCPNCQNGPRFTHGRPIKPDMEAIMDHMAIVEGPFIPPQAAIGQTITAVEDGGGLDGPYGNGYDAILTLDNGDLILVSSCGCCGGASTSVYRPKANPGIPK